MTTAKTLAHSVLLLVASSVLAVSGAMAGSLELRPAVDPGAVSDGAFHFTVHNEGTTPVHDLRLQASDAHQVECAAQTGAALAFAQPGVLSAGDNVACAIRARDGQLAGDAVVVVRSRTDTGAMVERSLHLRRPAALVPDQGIIAVLGGGEHLDGNADGLLDAGEVIDYDYTLINLGTGPLSALAVVDIDGGVTCPATSLPAGDWMTCTGSHVVTAAEDSDGFVQNEVSVAAVDADGNPVGAADMVLHLDLGRSADIRALKSPLLADDADANGYASVGDLLIYNFVLKNSGALPLAQVDLVEPDPTRIDTAISCAATTLGGQPFAGLGTGTLDPMDAVLCSAEYTITAADAAAGEADNLALVSAEPPFGGPVSGAAASAVVIPLPATVELSKALVDESGAEPGVVEPGETLSYQITLTNSGSVDATPIAVVDPLDPNVSFVSADHGGSEAGGVVSWSGLTVPAGGSTVLTVMVLVDAPLPDDVTRIVNLAHEAGTPPPDCDVATPPAGCVVTPTVGSVQLAKTLVSESGSAAGVAEPGELLTYQITLTNPGGSAVTGYGVNDPLDANVSFVSADQGGSEAGGIVSWSGLTVPAGGSTVLTVVVQVNDPLPDGVTQIVNLVHETGTTPPDCDVATPPASCVVIPSAGSVQLAKALTGESGSAAGVAEPGEILTYQITLTNSGGSAVTGYDVSDPLDANVSFVSADQGGTEAGGVVSWSGLTVPAGSSTVLTVVVAVNDPLPNTVTEIMNLVHETGTPPPDCTPGAPHCVILPVESAPALSLVKSAGASGPYAENDIVSYSFVVTNTGNVALDDVTVTDPLPGLTALSCSPALPATLAPGASSTCSASYVVTAADVAAGSVDNVATATGEDNVNHVSVSDSSGVTVQTQAPFVAPIDVPVRAPWMLALLLGLLGLVGWRELARRAG